MAMWRSNWLREVHRQWRTRPLPARKSHADQRQRATLALEPLEARVVLSSGIHPTYILFEPSGYSTPYTSAGPQGYTPAQVRQAYGFDQVAFAGGVAGSGAGQTIAIVDAYDDPTISSDLHQFDATFGLPDPPSFRKVAENGSGLLPAPDSGWADEISLDVEWSHAIAPQANILLVEAASSSFNDLAAAIQYAANQPGVSVVSMSFGGSEGYGENSLDSVFTTPAGHSGVTFVASSGDQGVISYPASSPNVLAVGGTYLAANSQGNYLGETSWNGSGGGVSSFEAAPAYQAAITGLSERTSPDVAYDADPYSGFAVFDSYSYGSAAPWIQLGGTSAGAPQWSALIAIADQGRALAGRGSLDGPSQTLPDLYGLPASDFHDITSGYNAYYRALPGYDLVTGLGSPVANQVVNDLVGGAATATQPTVTTLQASAATILAGQAVTLQATVGTVNGGAAIGSVTFVDGSTILGNVALNNGVAVFTTSALAAGTHTVLAEYSGNSSFGPSNSSTVTVSVISTSGGSGSSGSGRGLRHSGASPVHLAVVGADAGAQPEVLVYDAATGQLKFDIMAYPSSFTGGVRVAVGDVTGSGVPDIITVPGPGGGSVVHVYDGTTGQLIRSFFAFDPNFTGGAFVAAGDLNGDGDADIVCGADAGGGPFVVAYSGKDGSVLQAFFAYDPSFTGGVRVAVGDVNGDGFGDIICAPGAGGGPYVEAYSGIDGSLLRSFFAFSPDFTAGIYVAAGDVNGDGRADIITGAGQGGGPVVSIFSGSDGTLLASYLAFESDFTGGVRVAAVPFGGDTQADVIVAPGPGRPADAVALSGLTAGEIDQFFTANSFYTGGLFVAGG